MTRIDSTTIAALGAALLLVLAGCSSGLAPGDGGGTGDGSAADTGEVRFWISDDPGAIDDFEHLNVTITKVGLHSADGDAEDGETSETDDGESTETGEDDTATSSSDDADAMESTETEDEPEGTETDSEEEDPETEDDSDRTETEDEADDTGSEDDEDSEDGWETYEVDDRTVDLTELKGANATTLDVLAADAGTYDKVFIYVSSVEGVLKNGETVTVKLPSQKLHINERFEVSANSSVDFVFDVGVFKAGGSGKYILKPVISESGTDQEIDDVDDESDDEEREGTETDDDEEAERPTDGGNGGPPNGSPLLAERVSTVARS